MKIHYPIAVDIGSETSAFGVSVPDLPGCFSAGETLDEAFGAAEEATAAWIDAALDAGRNIPPPSTLGDIHARPEFNGWVFGLIGFDLSMLDDTIERVNVTLPRRVLHRLDRLAKANGQTRSGCIAHLTIMDQRPKSLPAGLGDMKATGEEIPPID